MGHGLGRQGWSLVWTTRAVCLLDLLSRTKVREPPFLTLNFLKVVNVNSTCTCVTCVGLPSLSASLVDLLTFKQNIPVTDWSSFLCGVFPALIALTNHEMFINKYQKLVWVEWWLGLNFCVFT